LVENSDGWVEIVSFAKVNLFLDVLGKRNDGYHEIISLMQTISLHDTLKIRLVEKKRVRVESTVEIKGKNTIEKVYETLDKLIGLDFGIEVRIHKRIPVGGGFGGGSSNAASVLRYLSNFLKLNESELIEIASFIGSDVPFFLKCGTAVVKGRGEIVEWMRDVPRYGVVLSIPRLKISTKSAYEWFKKEDYGKAPCVVMELYQAYLNENYEAIKRCSYNAFEKIILPQFWEIAKAKEYLEKTRKPLITMMTGSGSGVFGILPPGEGRFSFVDSSCQARKFRELL
jgi:4-diphosphocytidyl-2-C-methyl-D-erythritol kinase